MNPFSNLLERGRPAMQYIWDLQARVEALRAEVRILKGPIRRFRLVSFLSGFFVGTALGYWIFRLL